MGRTSNKPETTPEITPENTPETSGGSVPENGADYEERLRKMEKLLEEQSKLLSEQNKALEERDNALEEMKAAFESKKKAFTLPDEVIKNEARMKEKVKVFVTYNPLDPKSSHVPVLDPITNKVVQVKRGEEVEVSRAVYEILQHSMKSDKNTALIATELSEKFEKETENL